MAYAERVRRMAASPWSSPRALHPSIQAPGSNGHRYRASSTLASRSSPACPRHRAVDKRSSTSPPRLSARAPRSTPCARSPRPDCGSSRVHSPASAPSRVRSDACDVLGYTRSASPCHQEPQSDEGKAENPAAHSA